MSDLKQLMTLAKQQTQLELEVEQAELEVKARKQALLALSEKTIPDLMKALEVTSVRLDDGRQLELEEKYACGIPAAKQEEAFAWLEARELGGVIKDQVTIWIDKKSPVTPEALMAKLRELFGEDAIATLVERKRSVHASTLKALVTEQIEEGADLPFDVFGVYPVRRSKFKVTKKSKKGKDAMDADEASEDL